ncbi:hypothetical protein JDV02_007579 [Purpureocillium takamizusanense]|uniref:Uncharacterized protein n=1 Tax=Purpureocillium takamizusanense TaxID=2060973 RepID=A0A9Q8VE72_9HYPO|nr:uncharacterized protein JDV02_007579 [Purpureocillium takamizusanense]UNI21604.1 hypothetical protein JDV02_007579 [Purpureocillium takamizusanense]
MLHAMGCIEDKMPMPCNAPALDIIVASIHIRAMSLNSRRKGAAAYRPIVPSPLNPRSQEGAAQALRTRRVTRALRRNVGMSPAQRLLRYKAAEAWRSEATRRELAKWEKRAAEATARQQIKSASLRPEWKTRRKIHCEPENRNDDDKENRGEDGSENAEGEGFDGRQQYLFQMPDLGFFTPRRVVLAVGRLRMLPSLRMHNFVRYGDTAKT